jgi:hypothetical protein
MLIFDNAVDRFSQTITGMKGNPLYQAASSAAGGITSFVGGLLGPIVGHMLMGGSAGKVLSGAVSTGGRIIGGAGNLLRSGIGGAGELLSSGVTGARGLLSALGAAGTADVTLAGLGTLGGAAATASGVGAAGIGGYAAGGLISDYGLNKIAPDSDIIGRTINSGLEALGFDTGARHGYKMSDFGNNLRYTPPPSPTAILMSAKKAAEKANLENPEYVRLHPDVEEAIVQTGDNTAKTVDTAKQQVHEARRAHEFAKSAADVRAMLDAQANNIKSTIGRFQNIDMPST